MATCIMDQDEWRHLLNDRFPRLDPETEQRKWDGMKERLHEGDKTTGVVIARSPFGVWIDIGVGFPVLLLIPDIQEMTAERYQADDWCPIGSSITAKIVIFNDRERRIRVSQGMPHEWRLPKS
jgi:ribosomal protein S1